VALYQPQLPGRAELLMHGKVEQLAGSFTALIPTAQEMVTPVL
jgi:hypothetical protein